jgi:hypothetical protein
MTNEKDQSADQGRAPGLFDEQLQRERQEKQIEDADKSAAVGRDTQGQGRAG